MGGREKRTREGAEERERDRQTEGDRQTDRQRNRERETDREGCPERERERRVPRERERERRVPTYDCLFSLWQVCEWAVVPFLLCAIVVYSVVMKTEAQPVGVITREVGGRYYILYDDESSPLIPAPLPSATSSTNPGREGVNNATPGTSDA